MAASELQNLKISPMNIGDLLVNLNKITPQDVEMILKRQRETGERFGDAAKALSLISEADIQRVVSLQFDYSLLHSSDDSLLSNSLYCALKPFSESSEAIRTLRSELISRWIDLGHKSLPIVTSHHGEDASEITANLAVTFAQLGLRVLMVDANLRKPSMHKLFGAKSGMGLSDVVAGRSNLDTACHRVHGFKDLFILCAGTSAPNPQELLYKPAFREFFSEAESYFDIVIYETAPLVEFLDALPIVSNSKGAVLYSEINNTRISNLEGVKKTIHAIDAEIIGAVIVDGTNKKMKK